MGLIYKFAEKTEHLHEKYETGESVKKCAYDMMELKQKNESLINEHEESY